MTRVQLSVPLVYQPRGSNLCGQAAVKMILAYHGINISLPTLRREMKLQNRLGTYIEDLGSWFLQNGFEATIHSGGSNPPMWSYLDSDTLITRLQRRSRRNKKNGNYGSIKSLRRFLDEGGKYIPDAMRVRDIEQALKRKEPPIVSVQHSVLCNLHKNARLIHFVVPTGIRGGRITFNDSTRDCGKRTTDKEFFQNTCAKGGGEALFVSPIG